MAPWARVNRIANNIPQQKLLVYESFVNNNFIGLQWRVWLHHKLKDLCNRAFSAADIVSSTWHSTIVHKFILRQKNVFPFTEIDLTSCGYHYCVEVKQAQF